MFVALLVHTMVYAAFLEDPFTWVILAAGAALAPLAQLGRGQCRRPRRRARARPGQRPDGATTSRRLASTGAAYTASSVISKLFAVALLPVYTRHLTRADYGAAEVLLATVVALSIVFRLGIIEALLRFYYERRKNGIAVAGSPVAAGTRLCATAVGFLLDRDHARGAARRCRSPGRCPRRCSTGATPS